MTEVIRRRKLPHWDVPSAAYFVTTCLEGSIPARGLLELASFRADMAKRPCPAGQNEQEWKVTCWKKTFARTDDWLDRGEAARYLEDERLAQVVVDALYFFAGQRYDLLGYAIMPSHFHWVFQPLEPWVRSLTPGKRILTPRQRIVHSIDRHTAKKNAMTCSAGAAGSGSANATITGCAAPKSLSGFSSMSITTRSGRAWSRVPNYGGILHPGPGARRGSNWASRCSDRGVEPCTLETCTHGNVHPQSLNFAEDKT